MVRAGKRRLLIKNVQLTSRFSLISRVAEPLLSYIIHMSGVSSRLGSQRWRVRIPLSAKYSKCFRLVKTFSILNTSSISEMESWLAYSEKSAIGIDISRYSNSSFSKTTALNSVKVWIDGFFNLSVTVFDNFFHIGSPGFALLFAYRYVQRRREIATKLFMNELGSKISLSRFLKWWNGWWSAN